MLTRDRPTFAGKIDAFLKFREGGCHVLLPVDQKADWAFYTNGDDEDVQRAWARERGLSPRTSLADILRTQLEEHRADVFYNLDATGWASDFVSNLPGCVKCVIGWHALPHQSVSFAGYDLMVCNFPSTLVGLKQLGYRTEYFSPAYDPDLAPYAQRQERPIDVLFVGGYSRYHKKRAAILEGVANLAGDYNIAFHLDRSRLCRLAEFAVRLSAAAAREAQAASLRQINFKRSDFWAGLLSGAFVRQDRAEWFDRYAQRRSRQYALFRGTGGSVAAAHG